MKKLYERRQDGQKDEVKEEEKDNGEGGEARKRGDSRDKQRCKGNKEEEREIELKMKVRENSK